MHSRPARVLISAIGVAMVITGMVIAARLFLQTAHQQATEAKQAQDWQQFTRAVQGRNVSAPTDAGNVYLKLVVPRLANRDGVAVDGDWNSLKEVSMVHYHDSPAPGEKGNMLLAFHRETRWLDINEVQAGDVLKVHDRGLKTYTYVVDFVRVVGPGDVSLLRQTIGTDLTLITCDPPWRDYNRMIFRAHLAVS